MPQSETCQVFFGKLFLDAHLVTYTIFIWLVVLHTFEEIASGIFDLQFGHIKIKKNRYLLAASGLGAGFYSAIPIAIVGTFTFYLLLKFVFLNVAGSGRRKLQWMRI